MRILFLFLATVLLLGSCRKDNSLRKRYAGTYELITYRGFIMGPVYPPGNGRLIVLEEDGIYEERRHDTVDIRTTYAVENKKECDEFDKVDILQVKDYNEGRIAFQQDTLTISTLRCIIDGGTAFYRKVK